MTDRQTKALIGVVLAVGMAMGAGGKDVLNRATGGDVSAKLVLQRLDASDKTQERIERLAEQAAQLGTSLSEKMARMEEQMRNSTARIDELQRKVDALAVK